MGRGTGVFICIRHVLSKLSCMRYLAACCCNGVNTSCSTTVDLENNMMSSAYVSSNRGVLEENTWYGFCMPISGNLRASSVLTSVIRTVRKMTNRYGESGQPCLIPEPWVCVAERVLVSFTSKVGSV